MTKKNVVIVSVLLAIAFFILSFYILKVQESRYIKEQLSNMYITSADDIVKKVSVPVKVNDFYTASSIITSSYLYSNASYLKLEKYNGTEKVYKSNKTKCNIGIIKKNIIYNGKNIGGLEYCYEDTKYNSGFNPYYSVLIVVIVLAFFILIGVIVFFEKSDQDKIISLLDKINLSKKINLNDLVKGETFKSKDFEKLYEKIIELLNSKKLYEDSIRKSEVNKAQVEVSQQVAHDIRSPLTALNVVMKDLASLPENSRILLRSSIQRIQDIANNLVSQSSEKLKDEENLEENNLESSLLLPILEEIVSEKRYQLRSKAGVNITLDGEKAYGLFAKVSDSSLKRIISNLINNSVEAFEESGEVVITISDNGKNNSEVLLSIKDNGKGISMDILPKLAQRGASFGKDNDKESGSGLGLYHARANIEQWGGRFLIESEEGKGTEVKLYLPKAKAPIWFVPAIHLKGIKNIVILDDDESIHQVWDRRLGPYIKENDIDLKHARSPEDFKKLTEGQESLLCLCDYELLGYKETGLDLIERTKLEDMAILVTSRYAEEAVQGRCKKLGIKLIPKTSADLVPLTVEKSQSKVHYNAVLIDDDEMIRNVWQMAADDDNKRILTFADPVLFDEQVKKIDLQTPIYIDQNLKNKQLGTEVAKSIAKRGFKNLYLVTGEEAYRIKQAHDTSIFTKIVDKNPPW